MHEHVWSAESSSGHVKSAEGLPVYGKAWGGISGCVKICKGLSGFVKICGGICAQKAPSDKGLGNGRWRFQGYQGTLPFSGFQGYQGTLPFSGLPPDGTLKYRKLAEFTFSYKLLNHSFWVSEVSGMAEFILSCKLLDHLFWVS